MDRRSLLLGAACAALAGPASAQSSRRAVGPLRNARRSTSAAAPVLVGSTLNPADKYSTVILSNGNLTATCSEPDDPRSVRGTTSKSAGKWHFEFVIDDLELGSYPAVGVSRSSMSLATIPGLTATSVGMRMDGDIYRNSVVEGSAGAVTAGTVVAVEVDFDATLIYFQRQGGTRVGVSLSGIAGAPVFPTIGTLLGSQGTFNPTGPFVITPTSGFSAWG